MASTGLIITNICSPGGNYTIIPGMWPCKFPFTGPNCDQSYASIAGFSYNFMAGYTVLFGFIGFCLMANRFRLMFGLRKKYPAVWDSTGLQYLNATFCCFFSMLLAVDMDGLRGIYYRAFSDFLWEARIGLCYILAMRAILMWIGIIEAKGASSALPAHLICGSRIFTVWFFITGCIVPPLETIIVPAGSAYGIHNETVASIKYLSNGILGVGLGIGASVYGWRIFYAMGGTAAVRRLSTKSDGLSGADRTKLANLKRVMVNVTLISGMLFCGTSYGLLLFASRGSYCYWYEVVPVGGFTYWWSITNVLLLFMPFLTFTVLSLPGESSVAKKVGDAISTAMSGTKGSSKSRKVIVSSGPFDSNASNIKGSTVAMSSASSKSIASNVDDMESTVGGDV